MIADDEMWLAVLARDRGCDGRFVTGVLSTGIYCRPSCAARHPRRENVRFFADGAAARAAGLRPCLRCSPDQVSRDERAVLSAIAAIKAAGQPLALAGLAADAGYSVAHFQRVFTRATGLSPAAYARALRAERAAEALTASGRAGGRVTDAVYDAGFNAPSRFYEASDGRLGMAPSAWKNGGRGVTIRWAVVETSLGAMLVAATGKGVCRLSFGEGREALEARFPHAELIEGGEEFAALLGEVVGLGRKAGQLRAYPARCAGHGVSGGGVARLARNPAGRDPQLRPDRRRRRQAGSGAGGGHGQRGEQCRGADPLPPGNPLRRLAGGLCLWAGDQAGTAGAGKQAPPPIAAGATLLNAFAAQLPAFESLRTGIWLSRVPGNG